MLKHLFYSYFKSNFSTKEKGIIHRDKRVKYCVGKGVQLPFTDNFFDLVILDNVLDHCESPIDVLDEINRVIKCGGIIFFRQHVYNYWGKLMRSFMELFKIDSGHPFTFIKYQLENYFMERDWDIKRISGVGYIKTWLTNINSSTLKGIIQTLLFITRNRTLFILEKK